MAATVPMPIRGLIQLAHKAQGEQPADLGALLEWQFARGLMVEQMQLRGWMDESGHFTEAGREAFANLPALIEEEERAIAAAIPEVIESMLARFGVEEADAAVGPTEEQEAQP